MIRRRERGLPGFNYREQSAGVFSATACGPVGEVRGGGRKRRGFKTSSYLIQLLMS